MGDSDEADGSPMNTFALGAPEDIARELRSYMSKFSIHSAPIVAPCRDNPDVMMRRRPDGCIYTDGPRTERAGLMPLSDMASVDANRRYNTLADHEWFGPSSWLDYGCGHNTDAPPYGVGWDPATGEPEPEGHYDLVTLFHVAEHVDDPVALLRHVRDRFTPSVVVVETPNARDWMLSQSQAYREHWAWSDHRLVLTGEALLQAGELAGLGMGALKFVQRYPWENAIRWLREGKPGGHAHSAWMQHAAYADMLAGETDTLWCEWRM